MKEKQELIMRICPVSVVSVFSLCAAMSTLGNHAEKIYIDRGMVSYCWSPKVSDAAVELHLYDIVTIEIYKCYLPGTVYPQEYKNYPMLHFPLAWNIVDGKATILFPTMKSSHGIIRSYAWTSEDISNLDALQKAHLSHHSDPKDVLVLDGILRYRVFPWTFDVVDVLLLGTNQPWDGAEANIWYDISDGHIVVRYPLAQKGQEEVWFPCAPVAFRWAEMSFKQAVSREKAMIFREITSSQEGDFEPSGSVKLSGKRLLSDNAQVTLPEGIDWLIWGTDGAGKAKLSTMRDGKWVLLDDVPGFAIPKTVVVNNDSNYVMLLYNHSIDPKDVKASLEKILGYLKGGKLLNNYTVSPIEERKRLEREEAAREAAKPPPRQPTAEEIAQREWLRANPPVNDLFTAEEMTALFTEPDYGAIKNLYERGMAYDFHLRFTEAEKCFREDDSLKSKFILGGYYKRGRAGIPKSKWKANGMFNEIIRYATKESKKPTAEELCLAGRACKEMIEAGYRYENHAFKEQAEELFNAAEKQGYQKASLYPFYYNIIRDSVNTAELRIVMDLALAEPEPDVDFGLLVFSAGWTQLAKAGTDYQPRKAKNLAMLKRGIQAGLPEAEYYVGRLFDLGNRSNYGGALSTNPERAKFWLLRAAKRGDPQALLQAENRKYHNSFSVFTDEELEGILF